MAFHNATKQTFDRIAIYVGVGSSAGWDNVARLGIYADNGEVYPGSLILNAGTVDVSTLGLKAITINITLEPGLYWLIYYSDSLPRIDGTFPSFAPLGKSEPRMRAANFWKLSPAFDPTDPLPSTFPAGAVIDVGINMISLRRV